MKLRVHKFVTEMKIGAFFRGAYDVIGADFAIAPPPRKNAHNLHSKKAFCDVLTVQNVNIPISTICVTFQLVIHVTTTTLKQTALCTDVTYTDDAVMCIDVTSLVHMTP